MKQVTTVAVSAAITVLLAGCHVDQWVQPRVNSGAASDFYSDQQGDRPNVAGTVSFKGYVAPDARTTGKTGTAFTDVIPPASVKSFGGATSMLKRGQERYNIFCQPCHGVAGDGNGFVGMYRCFHWFRIIEHQQHHRPKQEESTLRRLFETRSNATRRGHQCKRKFCFRI